MIRYASTRGASPELSFADVLLTGLAPDGGLYVPTSWPTGHLAADRPYAEYAAGGGAVSDAYAGAVSAARGGREAAGAGNVAADDTGAGVGSGAVAADGADGIMNVG